MTPERLLDLQAHAALLQALEHSASPMFHWARGTAENASLAQKQMRDEIIELENKLWPSPDKKTPSHD